MRRRIHINLFNKMEEFCLIDKYKNLSLYSNDRIYLTLLSRERFIARNEQRLDRFKGQVFFLDSKDSMMI